jgi:hypothetical protein
MANDTFELEISCKNNIINCLRRSDACESTVEVVTPYWAANSSGKIRGLYFLSCLHIVLKTDYRNNFKFVK